jgi:hypothetical protein
MKTIGIVVSLLLALAAAFVAHTPWRVHGGRFVTEYFLLAGVIFIIAAVIGALSLRSGG